MKHFHDSAINLFQNHSSDERVFDSEVTKSNVSLSEVCNLEVELKEKRSSAISQLLSGLASEGPKRRLDTEEFSISIPSSVAELQSCYKLAYDEYLKKGYVNAGSQGGMITSSYDLDPRTMVVMVKNLGNETVATLSIVLDGECGLPSDELFLEELHDYRTEARLAEVVRLAIKEEYKNNQKMLVSMFDFVFNYVHDIANCRYLMIEVNPRHSSYYERLLWFESISESKKCPRVKDAPAVLLCLDFIKNVTRIENCDTDRNKRNMYRSFLKGSAKADLKHMIVASMAKLTPRIRFYSLGSNSDNDTPKHVSNPFFKK